MIFFGTESANVTTVKTVNTICEHCNNADTLYINIYRRHAHIFWIPVFPFTKTGSSYCNHCKEVLAPKQMPQKLKRQYKNIKANAKGPIWQFSGLAILVFLIAFGVYSNGKDTENTLSYLNKPAVFDVYEYKTNNGSYSTMKLRKFTNDSLFLSLNDYEIGKKSRLYKIEKIENYPEATYGYSKSEMKLMKSDGLILKINRD